MTQQIIMRLHSIENMLSEHCLMITPEGGAPLLVVRNLANSQANCLCSASCGIWMYVPPLLKAPPGAAVIRQSPTPSGSIRF